MQRGDQQLRFSGSPDCSDNSFQLFYVVESVISLIKSNCGADIYFSQSPVESI